MGMFDTVILNVPLVCPVCGGKESSHQTHAFEDVMATYRIGSVVRGGVLTGIIHETFWCSDCYKAENADKKAESPVYLIVWHSVLVGVEQDLARAEARLASVDRLDLIGWLDEAQRKEDRWRRNFYGLLRDVERWHEHLEEQKNPEPVPEGETLEQTQRRTSLRRLWGLPEEVLSAPDPLAAIIDRNKPDPKDDETDRGWF